MLHPCLIGVPFIITVVRLLLFWHRCSHFSAHVQVSQTYKHTHAREYIHISFIISAYLSPSGPMVNSFSKAFSQHTHTHSLSQPHTCARSSRVAFNSSLRHGWSIACLVCVCVCVAVARSLCLSLSIHSYVHGCMDVYVYVYVCMCPHWSFSRLIMRDVFILPSRLH